jgi:hypothetical protein
MKKKIAACFFGQLRGDEETFNSIYKNIIVPNEADVYIHTWNYYDDKDYIFKNEEIDYTIDLKSYTERHLSEIDRIDGFKKIFKPKKILLEEQIIFDNSSYAAMGPQNLRSDHPEKSSHKLCTGISARLYQGMRSLALSQKRSLDLIENIGDYEAVIMLRNDLIFRGEHNLMDLEMGENVIFFQVLNYMQVKDLIYYGSPNAVKEITEFSEKQEQIYLNRNKGWTCEFNETHLMTHIQDTRVDLRHYNFDASVKYPS